MALVYVDNWKLSNNNGRISDGYQLEMNSFHRPGPNERALENSACNKGLCNWSGLYALCFHRWQIDWVTMKRIIHPSGFPRIGDYNYVDVNECPLEKITSTLSNTSGVGSIIIRMALTCIHQPRLTCKVKTTIKIVISKTEMSTKHKQPLWILHTWKGDIQISYFLIYSFRYSFCIPLNIFVQLFL